MIAVGPREPGAAVKAIDLRRRRQRCGESPTDCRREKRKKKVPSRDRLLSGLVFTVFVREEKKRFSPHGPLVIEQQ